MDPLKRENQLKAMEAEAVVKVSAELKVQAFIAYPPIIIKDCNNKYGLAMLDNCGGMVSEMTTIGTYIHSNLFCDKFEEIGIAFHKIAVVEMRHLHIFSELALGHGAEPRLWSRKANRMVYWTPSYIQYTMTTAEMLRVAIEGENAAIAKYRLQKEWIKDKCICDILGHIIEDEKLHVDIFTRLYEKYC